MFKCDKCGECCRNLNKSPIYAYLHNGDGVCRYLRENLCSIYEKRPLFCRIDDCYEELFKRKMSYKDYIDLNYKYCKELKNQRRK